MLYDTQHLTDEKRDIYYFPFMDRSHLPEPHIHTLHLHVPECPHLPTLFCIHLFGTDLKARRVCVLLDKNIAGKWGMLLQNSLPDAECGMAS